MNDGVFIVTTCEPSPENVSTWLGMKPFLTGAAGFEMSTICTPPRPQAGS